MAVGVAVGVPFNKSGIVFSADALAWRTNIEANGGNIADSVLLVFDTYFFIPAVANGNILSQADRINIWLGNNAIASKTSVVNNFFASFVSSPTYDASGVKSSGTSYVNLNCTPSTLIKYTLNDCSYGYIVTAPAFTATKRAMGANSGANRSDSIRFNTPRVNAFSNSAIGGDNTNIATVGDVLIATKRNSSTNFDVIINNSIVNKVAASTARPTTSCYELTVNSDNVPDGNYDDKYHVASWHGSGSFDYAAFQTIISNLKAHL